MTLQQIKSRIRTSLDLWKNEGYKLMPEDLLEHIANQAQTEVRVDLRDVIEQHNSNFVADTRSYSLPEDFLLDHQLWVDADTTTNFQGYLMERRSYPELVEIGKRYDTTPDTNRPLRYTIRSDGIFEIDPISSSTKRFDLWYVPIPSLMTTDNAQPDFKDVYHEIVFIKAKQMVAAEIPGRVNMSLLMDRKYAEMLQKYRPLALEKESRMIRVRATSVND